MGGGPAGMMLGVLLARAGVDVLVLEKHTDFFRDFRGDTIHPSTLDLIDQLGLRDRFEAIPHTSIRALDVVVNGTRMRPVNFGTLPGANKEIALMPQWDFLTLLAEEGAHLPHFELMMGVEATGLLRRGDRVIGVAATTAGGELEIEADLTVAADGRASTVRAASALKVHDYGVPVDVLWFRLPRPDVNPPTTLGYLTESTMIVTIPRTDYYQTAMLIRKGDFDAVRERGLPAFREEIAAAAGFLRPVLDSLQSWDQVKLLSVQINRLERWHLPGFLCIGDAAHAMSPVFGVGINYAIQDAVATANIVAKPLANNAFGERELAAVQARRLPPTRTMQAVQMRMHRVIARPGGGVILPNPVPWGARLLINAVVLPFTRVVGTRVVGRGFRPERIRSELLV